MEDSTVKKKSILSSSKNAVKKATPERLLTIIRIINIFSSIGAIFVGLSTLLTLNDATNLASKFKLFVVSFSAAIAGVIVLTVNLPLGKTGKQMKEIFAGQFGFLFTHRGRALAMLFLATLCFSASPKELRNRGFHLLIGMIILIHSIFSFFVYHVHPTYGNTDLFPTTSDKEVIEKATEQPSFQSSSGFTGSINQNYQERSQFDTNQYAESPFTIDEDSDDNDFNDFALEDNNTTDRPFIDSETGENDGSELKLS